MGRRRAVPVAAEPFPVLDPTHPDGPRGIYGLAARGELDEPPTPTPGQRYTDPLPPPAGLDVDPEKWRRMPRAERRALARGRRR